MTSGKKLFQVKNYEPNEVIFVNLLFNHFQATSTSIENMECFNEVIGRLQESGEHIIFIEVYTYVKHILLSSNVVC